MRGERCSIAQRTSCLGRPSLLSGRRSLLAPKDRLSALRRRIQQEDHQQRVLQQQLDEAAVVLKGLVLFFGITITLQVAGAALQQLTASLTEKVAERVRSKSLAAFDDWLKQVAGNQGLDPDKRSGARTILLNDAILTPQGIILPQDTCLDKHGQLEQSKTLQNFILKAGKEGLQLPSKGGMCFMDALREAFKTKSGSPFIGWMADAELAVCPARLRLVAPAANSQLLLELKGSGLVGARDPSKPVVEYQKQQLYCGKTKDYTVWWFWIFPIRHEGQQIHKEVEEVPMLTQNIKGLHEDIYNICISMPLHEEWLPTQLLCWNSTYRSVQEIDYCKAFETTFQAWATQVLVSERQQFMAQSWQLATLVTKIVYSTVAAIVGTAVGGPWLGAAASVAMSFVSDGVMTGMATFEADGMEFSPMGLIKSIHDVRMDPSPQNWKNLGIELAFEVGLPFALAGLGKLVQLGRLKHAQRVLARVRVYADKALRLAQQSGLHRLPGTEGLRCMSVTFFKGGGYTLAPAMSTAEHLAVSAKAAAQGTRVRSFVRTASHLLRVRTVSSLYKRLPCGRFVPVFRKPLTKRVLMAMRHPARALRRKQLYEPFNGWYRPVYKVSKDFHHCVARRAMTTAAMNRQPRHIFKGLFRARCAEHLSSQQGFLAGLKPKVTVAINVKNINRRLGNVIAGLKEPCADCAQITAFAKQPSAIIPRLNAAVGSREAARAFSRTPPKVAAGGAALHKLPALAEPYVTGSGLQCGSNK